MITFLFILSIIICILVIVKHLLNIIIYCITIKNIKIENKIFEEIDEYGYDDLYKILNLLNIPIQEEENYE